MSEFKLVKGQFSPFLSINPLKENAEQQWGFLSLGDAKLVNQDNKRWNKFLEQEQKKGDLRKSERKPSWNISDYQTAIYRKIAGNYREIYWILSLTHNLRREDLYDVFNAKTLDGFFKNLLIDCEQDKRHPVDFDYRTMTCEIAHVMLKWSVNYLKSSPQFRSNKNTLENIERISNDFESLSMSLFMKEPLQELSIDDKKKSHKLFNDWSVLKGMLHDDYPEIKDALNLNAKRMNQIVTQLTRLRILIDNTKSSKSTTSHQKEYKELFKKFESINEDYYTLQQLESREKESNKIERKRYEKLEKYFPTTEPLELKN